MLNVFDNNYAMSISTLASAAVASGTASASAVASKQLQLMSFDASSSGQAATVKVMYDSVPKATYRIAADTVLHRDFGTAGPVAPTNQAIQIEVTPDVATTIYANVFYRQIF